MNAKFFKKILLIFRVILILIVLILIFWLFLKDFVGGGTLVIKNDFETKDEQISDLEPAVRIREKEQTRDGDWYQSMYVDPVYFKINPPREFERARIKIRFKSERQPFFQVGVKGGAGELDFKFSTLEFRKLDELKWDRMRQGDLVLYQRFSRYKSIQDFMNEPPTDGRIAVYNLELKILEEEKYQSAVLNQKTDLEHVSYIIASYREAEEEERGWKVGEAEFEISRANFFDGRLVFILSAPEIDLNKGEIDISEIEVTLTRPEVRLGNLFGEMREYLKDWVDK